MSVTKSSASFSSDSVQIQASHKGKKSFFVQGKFNSYFDFFAYSLCYTISIDCFVSVYNVGKGGAEINLIQYFIGYMFVGIPLYYIELVLGRYSQMSMVYFKHMLPLAHGVIYISLLIAFLYSIKYGLFLTDYCLFFLLVWQKTLPWMQCSENEYKKAWGKCFSGMNTKENCEINCLNNYTYTSAYLYYVATYMGTKPNDTVKYTIDFPTAHRSIGLVAGWTLIFIFVGIIYQKFPRVLIFLIVQFYIFLTLLNMGTTSTVGGMMGIRYLFNEDLTNLGSLMPWSTAVSIPVKELRLAHPFIILNGSRLKTKNNLGVVTLGVCTVSFLTSLLCSMFFQSSAGMVVRRAKLSMHNATNIGQKYDVFRLFVLIPQSLGYLAVPQIWSLLYFACAMSIILANEITLISVIHTSVADVWPSLNRYQTYIYSGFCGFACICGFSILGETNFKYVDFFMSMMLGLSELITIAFISLAVLWIYGVRRLSDDICFMTDVQPTKFWKICWYLMPIATCFSVYQEHLYHVNGLSTLRKLFVDVWLIICISPIPILIFYEIFKYMKLRNLTGILRPTYMWGPSDPQEKHRRLSFNPRKQTTYQSKHPTCPHNCLLTSKVLKNLYEQETQCTANYLESIKQRSTTIVD